MALALIALAAIAGIGRALYARHSSLDRRIARTRRRDFAYRKKRQVKEPQGPADATSSAWAEMR